jgi:hypothetical protein
VSGTCFGVAVGGLCNVIDVTEGGVVVTTEDIGVSDAGSTFATSGTVSTLSEFGSAGSIVPAQDVVSRAVTKRTDAAFTLTSFAR